MADMKLPYESVGNIFHNKLKNADYNKVCMIDVNTGEEITFGKFLKWSIILANELKNLDVKKGSVITILSRNSWKYILTLISGFYVGAQINLLSPDYTSDELEILLSNCEPTLLFCSQKSLNNVLKLKDKISYPKNIVIFDSNDSNQISFDYLLENNRNDLNFSPSEVDSDDVALILTSSGTTGFPKCVLLTNANVINQLVVLNEKDLLDITENEILIGFLPFFHIFGVLNILTCIFHASRLVILEKFVPDTFLKAIEDYKITKLIVVPTILFFLAKNPLVEKYDISSVKEILFGGAICTQELEKLMREKFRLPIRQGYGMTEVCVASVVPKNTKIMGSIGKPVPGNQINICDVSSGDALPPHQIGELRIKGSGVMKGYLGNKEATEASFDENGFIKTGDLGYYDEDGFFYLVDRMKDMIKYKGFQVAPAELENLLLQHRSVKEVSVVGKPDLYAGELPTAFIVKKPNENVTEEEVIQYVEKNISVHKRLYGGVKFLEELPKNSVGKILKNKLKELL